MSSSSLGVGNQGIDDVNPDVNYGKTGADEIGAILDTSIIEKGTKWVKEHPMFIGLTLIAITGLVYLAVFRKSDPETDENSVDNMLLGEDTENIMKELDLNLTKKANEAHLTSSEEDENEENDIDQGNNMDTLSNDITNLDIDKLEEYTDSSSI